MLSKSKAIKFGILFLSFILTIKANAQTPCEVSVEALKGIYTGDCKHDKANGEGKATGTDFYEGNFKNGYPDGEGAYRYANGDYYKGSFKKGLREGAGEFHHPETNGHDSISVGFWAKDKYSGIYEQPYKIITRSVGIVKVAVRGQKDAVGNVRIISKPEYKSSTGMTQAVTYIGIEEGNFTRQNNVFTINEATTTLEDVTYPLKLLIYFGQHTMELDLFEGGAWDVEVVLGRP